MQYTNLADAKAHLKIEDDFTLDDEYIIGLLNVAELAVQNYCNDSFTGYTPSNIPLTIVQATYFLMTNFYSNRQMVSFASQAGQEIPYTFQFLLNPYKNYVIS